MKKIENGKDIKEYFNKKIKSFDNKIVKNGGYSYYIRALVVQVLWIFCLYLILTKALKIENVFNENAFVIVLIVVYDKIIRPAIEDKVPSLITEIITGKIAFKLSTKLLNISFGILLGINIMLILIFAPIKIFPKSFK